MIILLILISINQSFCIFEEERCLETSVQKQTRSNPLTEWKVVKKMEVILNKNPIWILNPRLNSSRSTVSRDLTVNPSKPLVPHFDIQRTICFHCGRDLCPS